MLIYPIIFFVMLSFSVADFGRKKKIELLYFAISFLILFVGFRDSCGVDSQNYIDYFNNFTDSITNWQGKEKQYKEFGFYYLSVIIKTIWNNIDFYFLIIAWATLGIYLKTIKKWSLYPILSLCVYYARFMILREMNQIRAGLAISIILFSLFYLVNGDRRKYVFGVLIASCFHVSSIIAIGMIWFYKQHLTVRKTCYILLGAMIGGVVISSLLKSLLIALGGMIALTYINTFNLGLMNPVVLFQIMICLLYVYFGPVIGRSQKGYEVIRNAYVYSTIILMLTSGLGVIGGRLATIFATCEIFILPSFIKVVRPRAVGYIAVLIAITALFWMNYVKLLDVSNEWSYERSFF